MAGFVLCSLCFSFNVTNAIDSDEDGLSDVFSDFYGGSLDPGSDTDGDGFNAVQEYRFGGSPDNYGDLTDVFHVDWDESELSFEINGRPWRRYRITQSSDLVGWTEVEGIAKNLSGNREYHSGVISLPGERRFYRIEGLEPVDTDMDGLNDWEEMIVGSNPEAPDTDNNGILDGAQYTLTKDPNAYTVVFEDDFDGSSLDRSKWRVITGGTGWGNRELQYFKDSPQNIEVSSGTLKLKARKENFDGREWTAARITTAGLHSFKYGKIEARIKVPVGPGLWPAFWMLGDSFFRNSWPICGEIDIMETGHVDQIGTPLEGHVVYSTTHRALADGATHNYVGETFESTPSLGSAFHIYGVEWSEESIVGYIDDQPYFTMDISEELEHESIEEFHDFFYLILNLAVGGNFTGIVEENKHQITSNLPASMEVDWVRVSQRWGPASVKSGDGTMNFPPSGGSFVIYKEETPSPAKVGQITFDVNSILYDWNNEENPLVPLDVPDPREGENSLAFKAQSGNWAGFGIHSAYPRDLSAYRDDYLHFSLKTSSQEPFKIGMESGSGNPYEGSWIFFKPGVDPYSFQRDGQWHDILVPGSHFRRTHFEDIRLFFGLATGILSNDFAVEIDDIYFVDNDPYQTPISPVASYDDYLVYNEEDGYRDIFAFDQDGPLSAWHGMDIETPSAGDAFEGFESLELQIEKNQWFGMGIEHSVGEDLRRYSDDYLHVAIKTVSSAPFKIGIKSGKSNGVGLDSGESWIYFREGETPYGFQRNNTWQNLTIPMSHFQRSDFSDITQLFMLAGEAFPNAFNIQLDNIYWEDRESLSAPLPQQPVHQNYIIFSEEAGGIDQYLFDTDGTFFFNGPGNYVGVLTETLEGCDGFEAWRFSFLANAWFWGGIHLNQTGNFSAYSNGHLHIALRSSQSGDFRIGIKSGGNESWIQVPNSGNFRGFTRDGNWHKISIPLSDFSNKNLSTVEYLFMIARDNESQPFVLEVDDLYWSKD